MAKGFRSLKIAGCVLTAVVWAQPAVAQFGAIELHGVEVQFEGRNYAFDPNAENIFEIEQAPQFVRRRAQFEALVSFNSNVGGEVVRVIPGCTVTSDADTGAGGSVFDPAFFILDPNGPQTNINFENVPMQQGEFQIVQPPTENPMAQVTYTVFCELFRSNNVVSGEPFTKSMEVRIRQRFRAQVGDGDLEISAQSLREPISVAPGSVVVRTVELSSAGNASFEASASTDTGGDWLSVSPAAGTVSPQNGQSLGVRFDTAGLAPGAYSGGVAITDPRTNETTTIEVVLIVRGDARSLGLSRNGFFFQGRSVRSQFEVFNVGPGEVNWTASVRTLSGGDWLSLSATQGVTSEDAPSPPVEVVADPNAPNVGFFENYGLIEVRADTDNSPQTIVVILNTILLFGTLPTIVTPTGFLIVSGDGTPLERTLNLFNPGLEANFTVPADFSQQAPWLTVFPTEGELPVGEDIPLTVRVDPTGLRPGVHEAEFRVVIQSEVFPEFDPEVLRIPIQLVVVPNGGALASLPAPSQGGLCAPTRLVVVLTALQLDFRLRQGFPTAIEAVIVDDCGTPIVEGDVVAEFSSGDPQLGMQSLRDGRWGASWPATTPADEVTVTIRASQAGPPALEGIAQAVGRVIEFEGFDAVPVAGSPVSAVSFAAGQPNAPGGYVAVFGTRLAEGAEAATVLPLPETLANSSVLIGGRSAPLLFAGEGQINAIIPWELPVNTTHQALVLRGTRVSAPIPVTVASAQPAVFSLDSSGRGQAIVERVALDGARSLAVPGTPARPGEFLVIYASGLGPVTNRPESGAVSPSAPLAATMNPVTATLGGVDLQVQFAGLTPGFAGLYQVNAPVPVGVAEGDAVALTLTSEGLTSREVTIAVGQ